MPDEDFINILKKAVLSTPVQSFSKKALLKFIVQQGEELATLKREIPGEIERQVVLRIKDKIDFMEALYKDLIVQKELFIDKGVFTREEINAQYAAMRKKENGGP